MKHNKSGGSQNNEMNNVKYKFTNRIDENHKKELYYIQFNHIDPRHERIFATCGSNRVTVYEALEDGEVALIQTYVDPNEKEEFFTCVWSIHEETGTPLLVCAGQTGIIRIIDCHTHTCLMSLPGHGNAVNEIRVHPKDPLIILSVSEDEAIRIWHIGLGVCVAVLGGEHGHLDQVLSGDFHLDGNKIVSCGTDHFIRVWDITPIYEVIDKFASSIELKEKLPSPVYLQFPEFSTNKIHSNYVDSVRWFGDAILSKSVESKICIWKIVDKGITKSFRLIENLEFKHCEIWYIRMGMDVDQTVLFCGNKTGKIFMWDLTSDNPQKSMRRITNARCLHTVRHVDMSSNKEILVSVCDNGTVWRWDRRTDSK